MAWARSETRIHQDAHKSIQRVYLLQNRVEAQSYWAVLFAKTANAIGLLPEKRDSQTPGVGARHAGFQAGRGLGRETFAQRSPARWFPGFC
jgi:hypothetical protein